MAGDRDRARLFGYLARRGHDPDVASAAVRALSSGAGEDAGHRGE
jgi:SOS response regulatory protein OraA/RecX